MADETTNQAAPVTTPAPSGQPAPAEGFKIPEKFAGKGLEDVVKAYQELERAHGEQSGKLKEYDSYKALGDPETLKGVINYAREKYQALERGDLVEKARIAQLQAQQTQQTTPSEPWKAQDWEYKPQAEQASAIANYVKSETARIIAEKEAQFSNQFQQYGQNFGNQQQILLDAIQAAIETGGKVNVQDVLTEAAAMASKSPRDLIRTIMENKMSPDKQKAEVERLVNERIAELKQKEDNEKMGALDRVVSPRARFNTKNTSKSDVDKKIIADLRKNGINLL